MSLIEQLKQVPFEQYLANPHNLLSSHRVGAYMESPAKYRMLINGELPDKNTDAMLIGHSSHCLVLEGLSEYQNEYMVGGPVNPKTGRPYGNETKAFKEWASQQTKTVLTPAIAELNENIFESVQSHDHATGLLGEGVAEHVIYAELDGMQCQSRLDWYNPSFGIIDFKTCNELQWFEYEATKKWNYIRQLAFYRMMVRKATGKTERCWLIATEKQAPFATGVWEIDADSLNQAEEELHNALIKLAQDTKLDTFDTGYEEVRTLAYWKPPVKDDVVDVDIDPEFAEDMGNLLDEMKETENV